MIGIVLIYIALLLIGFVAPVALIWHVLRSFKTLKQYFFKIAVSLDQMGNVIASAMMNDVLIKQNSKHKFGNEDETISAVIGKNKITETLTIAGYFIYKTLNFIEKNHCENAVLNEK